MKKEQLRQALLQKREALTEVERKQYSTAIQKHILQSIWYQRAEEVFTYIGVGAEVDTMAIVEDCWQKGKTVAVPVTGKQRFMVFQEVRADTLLLRNKWGLLEPVRDERAERVPTKNSLFLVPVVVIDTKGNRIGYGGGYYDTYFAEKKQGIAFGVAFSMQVVEEVQERDITDIPLDGIVTEHGMSKRSV